MLHLAKWTSLLNAHHIANLTGVLFIVRLEALRLLICAFIDSMLLQRLYGDNNSLVHFIADYGPNFLLVTVFLSLLSTRSLCSLLCHTSASNSVNRCNKRAMSLRVCENTRLFFTSPRWCCKRRLNSFIRKSLSSRCVSATVSS